MSLKSYRTYKDAENDLIHRIIKYPDFNTKTTYERLCEGFILSNPLENKNDHSNYDYADDFFKWMLSGEKVLDEKLLGHNPWVQRFVSTIGLPDGFSASYGWKLQDQLPHILEELRIHNESRRSYFTILMPEDHIIRTVKTTHEYPCTIGLHVFIRLGRLYMIVNMRSNNCYSVMPYDVYNFTSYQAYLAGRLDVELGTYFHQINNAHLYNGDVRRINELNHKTKANGNQSNVENY